MFIRRAFTIPSESLSERVMTRLNRYDPRKYPRAQEEVIKKYKEYMIKILYSRFSIFKRRRTFWDKYAIRFFSLHKYIWPSVFARSRYDNSNCSRGTRFAAFLRWDSNHSADAPGTYRSVRQIQRLRATWFPLGDPRRDENVPDHTDGNNMVTPSLRDHNQRQPQSPASTRKYTSA